MWYVKYTKHHWLWAKFDYIDRTPLGVRQLNERDLALARAAEELKELQRLFKSTSWDKISDPFLVWEESLDSK